MPSRVLGAGLFSEQTIQALAAMGQDTVMGETVTREGRAGAAEGKVENLQVK